MKKPIKPTIYEGNIPDELKDMNQWCCWKYVQNKKEKWTKPPCNTEGQTANHIELHYSFEEVLKASENEDIAGIGFSMRNSDNICGIDLDHCFKNGKLTKKASKIIEKCQSYTEISPSGEGIRIFGTGTPKTIKNDEIEVYSDKRYLTVTGNIKDFDFQIKDIEKITNKITKKYKKTSFQSKFNVSSVGDINPILISKLAYLDPDVEYNTWYSICQAIHDHFQGNDQGLNLFVRWSRGDFWKKKASKFEEEDCSIKYESVPGEVENKRTVKTIDYFYNKARPKVVFKEVKIKKSDITFPKNPYKDAPEFAQMLFSEFKNRSANPIEPFLFMAVESALQYVVGSKVLTPQRSRTTTTPMLGAGLSTAGKDLNTNVILMQFRDELLSLARKQSGDTGHRRTFALMGQKPGNYTSPTSFLKMVTNKDVMFWLDTEASGILKILSNSDNNPHGGGALALTLNELYDGHAISGKNLAKENIRGIDYPQIPICWLTQIDTFSQIISQELFHVGFLGRLDYFFDYETRIEQSTWEKGFASTPFEKSCLRKVLNFAAKINTKEPKTVKLDNGARELLKEWDEQYILNKNIDPNFSKFLKRITMSAEKRLSVYAFLNRSTITRGIVQAHIPIMDYQLKIRTHIYNNELSGNDLYRDMKIIVAAIQLRAMCKMDKKGIIQWSHFYKTFRNRFSQKYPKLVQASNMQREIYALVNQGLINFEDIEGKRGKYLSLNV